MRKLIIAIIIILGLIPCLSVQASDVTKANYLTRLIVSNNSSETKSNVVGIFELSTSDMITAGMIADNVSDAAMRLSCGSDTAFQASNNSTSPWITWVNSISGKSQQDQYLYSGGATGGKYRYFPDSSGLSITDAADIELSDNFTLEFKGHIDTANGTDKNLYYKQAAFKLYVSPIVSGNLTASIIESTTPQDMTLYPSATGNYTGIASVSGASTHWEAVDDPSGTPDDDATYVYTGSSSTEKDAYELQNANLPADTVINSVKVYFRHRGYVNVGDKTGYARPYLRLNGSETTGTEEGVSGTTYANFNEELSRPGGGDWSNTDIDSLQVAMGLRRDAAAEGSPAITQSYVVVNYTLPISVTATGVSSGEHTIEVTASNTTTYFGNSSIEVLDATIVDQIRATRFTTTEGSFCQSIVAYVYSASGLGDRKVKGAIYDSSLNLLGETGEEDLPTDGAASWRTLSFASAIELSQDTIYWLAVWGGASNVEQLKAYYADGETNQTANDSPVYNGYPDPLVPDGYSNHVWSVYAEVIPGFAIIIDGTEEDRVPLAGASVPDNANNVTLFENGSMPYVEEFNQYEGTSNLILSYDLARYYEDSTIEDLIGSNDGTATFRTAKSDPDVTKEVASQVSTIDSSSPESQYQAGWQMITSVTTEPTGLFAEGGTNWPGAAEIQTLANESDVPYMAWIIPLAFATSLGGGVFVYAKTHNSRMGRNGSLFFMWLASVVIYVLWYVGGGGVIPGWGLIPYSLWAFILMIWFNPFRTQVG